jgi:hypothetical protein
MSDVEAPPNPIKFWQSFERVAASYPNVLKNVIGLAQCSTCRTSKHLRGASRSMREAVNRSVTTILCYRAESFHQTELSNVFPEADHLIISLNDTPRASRQIDCSLSCPAVWLEHLIACSPLLLERVTFLELDLTRYHQLYPNVDGSIAKLLCRCASFESTGSSRQKRNTSSSSKQQRQPLTMTSMLPAGAPTYNAYSSARGVTSAPASGVAAAPRPSAGPACSSS